MRPDFWGDEGAAFGNETGGFGEVSWSVIDEVGRSRRSVSQYRGTDPSMISDHMSKPPLMEKAICMEKAFLPGGWWRRCGHQIDFEVLAGKL